MDNKKKRWIIVLVLLLVVAIGGGTYYWYQNYEIPKQNAIARFDTAVEKIEAVNTNFQKKIDEAQKLLDQGDTPYDKATKDNLQNSINDAKVAMVVIPELPSNTDEINTEAEELEKPVDYSKKEEAIDNASSAFKDSVKQLEQITAPTEQFVLERLKGIDTIVTMAPVTEDHDPNGNLNKAGGYTSTVYFESSNVDQSKLYEDDLIEKGCEAGGAIEVYRNTDDANKRNGYLATFDGSVISSGSHEVLGTIIIRTSDELTATQQKELTKAIKDSFLRLDK